MYPQVAVLRRESQELYAPARKYTNECEAFRKAVYILYELPVVKGVATDDETKQCCVCKENLKDHTLPCGHIYCIECIEKIKTTCPTCKKGFLKKSVIKLYY